MDNSQQALAQLQQAQNAAQNPQALLQQQQNQLGIQSQRDVAKGLRGAIDNTTNLLKQVAPSVMGRTQGSLVTNAQATRQIGNEQAPIAANLNEQTTAYNRAAQDLTDLESRAAQAASAAYAGQQDRLSYLQNLYNTLYQREQDAATREEQRRAAAAQEAFNYNLAQQASGTSQSPTQKKAAIGEYSFKNGTDGAGGFRFRDSIGNSISAYDYAKLNGANFIDLLSKMAASGDAYARNALNSMGPAGSIDMNKFPLLFSTGSKASSGGGGGGW